ncbi:MAG: hypothetical protein ACLRSW_09970 [Christensenellaceae bacterium]
MPVNPNNFKHYRAEALTSAAAIVMNHVSRFVLSRLPLVWIL